MKPRSKLYLTYRSEYLVLHDLCVGVRDRRSGAWLPLHIAVCSTVLGPVDSVRDSPLIIAPARIGERLCLRSEVRRIVTGPIVAVEEPERALLEQAEQNWQEQFQPSDPRHSSLGFG